MASNSPHVHNRLIDLGMALEYFKDQLGVCRGATMAWMSAWLTDPKTAHKIESYIHQIFKDWYKILSKINALKDKVSTHQPLTDEEKEQFQYLAFFEQITLFMYPERYEDLFNKRLNQSEVKAIGAIAHQDTSEKRSPISVIYKESMIVDKNELETFLKELVETIGPDIGPYAISFSSSGHNLGCMYFPKENSWRFLNISHGEPALSSFQEVVDGVIEGLQPQDCGVNQPKFTTLVVEVITEEQKLSASLRESLKKLKESHPITSEIAARVGEVSLLWMASSEGDLTRVKALLDAGSDVNKIEKGEKISPLWMASQNGHDKVARMLLSRGADANQATLNGFTPLMVACMTDHVKVVKELLAGGADIEAESNDGVTPLISAAQWGCLKLVQTLIAADADINRKNKNEVAALHLAAQEGRESVVECLLKSGAQIDIMTNTQVTPLWAAAAMGQSKIVEKLVSYGANINSMNDEENSPLHVAALRGHLKVVEVLSRAGASLNLEDRDGDTAIELAGHAGHIEVVEALLTAYQNSKEELPTPLLMITDPSQLINKLTDYSEDLNLKKSQKPFSLLIQTIQSLQQLKNALSTANPSELEAIPEVCDASEFFYYDLFISISRACQEKMSLEKLMSALYDKRQEVLDKFCYSLERLNVAIECSSSNIGVGARLTSLLVGLVRLVATVLIGWICLLPFPTPKSLTIYHEKPFERFVKNSLRQTFDRFKVAWTGKRASSELKKIAAEVEELIEGIKSSPNSNISKAPTLFKASKQPEEGILGKGKGFAR